MSRVLLTGAGGYIGRHMQGDLVAQGYEVHAVSRIPRENADRVSWHALDLLDAEARKSLLREVKPTHLVHLAWVTDPGKFWESPLNNNWLEASIDLLKLFEEHGGKRALLTGSCAEYDWSNGDCVEDETPLVAGSLYAESKLALRYAARKLAERFGLELAWARLFFSFGPYEQPGRLVSVLVKTLMSGERAKCVDGDVRRDFLYAPDAASALIATLDSSFTGDINIASGSAMTIRELCDRFAAALGFPGQVDYGAYPRPPGDPDRIAADVSRLRDEVGWTPGTDLDTAIRETVEWWRTVGDSMT